MLGQPFEKIFVTILTILQAQALTVFFSPFCELKVLVLGLVTKVNNVQRGEKEGRDK